MYIIKTDKVHRFDRTIVIPGVGETKISSNGEFTVDSLELAQQIESYEAGFYVLQEVDSQSIQDVKDNSINVDQADDIIISKVQEDDLSKTDTSNDIGIGSNDEVDENDLKKSLKTLSIKELKNLAETFPEDKEIWSILKKEGLIEYLETKLIKQ